MSVGAVLAARRGCASTSASTGMFGYRSTQYTYGYDRHEASVRELQRKARLHFTIKDYDVHGKGSLERAQLVLLLTDTDSSTPPGVPPTEEAHQNASGQPRFISLPDHILNISVSHLSRLGCRA